MSVFLSLSLSLSHVASLLIDEFRSVPFISVGIGYDQERLALGRFTFSRLTVFCRTMVAFSKATGLMPVKRELDSDEER